MEILSEIWNSVIIRPMINSLVLLYSIFFSNFGIAIIIFTVIVRAAMIPLSIRQSRSMKAMTAVQPKMKALQERYKNDRQKLSQETMKLYRENGINPIGCLGPLVLQMPIFLGLFWALRGTLPSTPERLADLSRHLYPWLPMVNEAVPLNGQFLWLDLAEFSSSYPMPLSLVLPILVGVSMFVMQKMTTMPSTTPQQESTNRMMLWLMPGMFGVFTLSFEAGLALYWIVSNVVGIVIQGFVTGWQPLIDLPKSIINLGRPSTTPAVEGQAEPSDEAEPAREADTDENDRDDGQDRRRGNRNRPKGARRRAPGRRNRRR